MGDYFVFLLVTAVAFDLRIFAVVGSRHQNDESDHGEDYCEMETFRPQCLKTEVIVMETAIYGRRYRGRCLEAEVPEIAQNPLFLGCSADVIGQMDYKCSGRKQCEIRIPDADLQQTRPCPKGVDMFLEVRYKCVEVVEEDRSCVVSVTSSPVHIARPSVSSSSNIGLHCGTKTQPWLLEAPAGQRINISLLDFTPITADFKSQDLTPTSHSSSSSSSNISTSCVQQRYGYIIDKSAPTASKKNVSVCGGARSQRLTNVYLSASNTVELVLAAITEINRNSNFLVRVEAVGCSDLIPPEDAWLKRTDNEAVVGCYTSRQTWHLKCKDRRWIGVVSNCTQYDAVVNSPQEVMHKKAEMSDYQVLMIVAVAFAGLAVCLTIICCGIYCLRRYALPDKMADNTLVSTGTKYSYVKAGSRGTNGNAAAASTPQYFVLDQNAVALQNRTVGSTTPA